MKINTKQMNKSNIAAFLSVNANSKKQRNIKGRRDLLFFTFMKYKKINVTAKNDITAENEIQN